MTASPSHAVAPVSAVCAAFAVQPSAYPPEISKPDVAPVCGSAASTKKEIKMSTEFYCEEFPIEQNGRCRRSKICWKPARKIAFIS